jgi:sortase A
MRKFLFILLFFIATVSIAFGPKWWAGIQPKAEQAKKVLSAQTVAEPAVPQTISIPSIDVEAHLESVGMDKEKRMDTPKDADNGAWYNLGYKPGQVGSAVIAGHLDKENGDPAVFWRVKELSKGDKIIITDVENQTHTFAVVNIEKYPYNDFPLQKVFGSSSKPMLNLITCQGDWDKEAKNYSHRMVIFAELVE